MSVVIGVILPFLSGLCDRIRGGFPSDEHFPDERRREWKNHCRHAVKFVYGMVVCMPFGLTWWQFLIAGITWKFGEQIAGNFGKTFRHFSDEKVFIPHAGGYEQTLEGVIGSTRPKWSLWEKLHPLLRVGGLWPLLTVAALVYWHHDIWLLIPAMMVATTMAALVAKAIGDVPEIPHWLLDLSTAPAWQEFFRGFFISFFVLLLA
jgi:hypothetical protein